MQKKSALLLSLIGVSTLFVAQAHAVTTFSRGPGTACFLYDSNNQISTPAPYSNNSLISNASTPRYAICPLQVTTPTTYTVFSASGLGKAPDYCFMWSGGGLGASSTQYFGTTSYTNFTGGTYWQTSITVLGGEGGTTSLVCYLGKAGDTVAYTSMGN
jgi:hypothetical protein